jgi:hypothetical protein
MIPALIGTAVGTIAGLTVTLVFVTIDLLRVRAELRDVRAVAAARAVTIAKLESLLRETCVERDTWREAWGDAVRLGGGRVASA